MIDSIIANGSLDGNAFSNALVTLTLTGNTSSITSGSYYYDLIGPATVTVAGTGSDSLSGTVDVAVCDLSACNPASAGFNQQIGSGPDYNIFGTINNAAFVTYGLNSSFGPVSGASYGNNRTWPTDDGSLVISSGVGANTSTFTAVLSSPGPIVSLEGGPSSSPVLLFGTSVGGGSLEQSAVSDRKTITRSCGPVECLAPPPA